jgi:hypothetical protein
MIADRSRPSRSPMRWLTLTTGKSDPMADRRDVLHVFEALLASPTTTDASLGRFVWTHRSQFLDAMRAAATPGPRLVRIEQSTAP